MICGIEQAYEEGFLTWRERLIIMRVERMDVVVVELFLLWLSEVSWREFPQALGLWRRLQGSWWVWYEEGAFQSSNQADRGWLLLLILLQGNTLGLTSRMPPDRHISLMGWWWEGWEGSWRKECEKKNSWKPNRGIIRKPKSYVLYNCPDYNDKRLWMPFII